MESTYLSNNKKLKDFNKVNQYTILFPTKIRNNNEFNVLVRTNDNHYLEENKTFLSNISVCLQNTFDTNKIVDTIEIDLSKSQYEKIKKFYSLDNNLCDKNDLIDFNSLDELIIYYCIAYRYCFVDLNNHILIKILLINIYDNDYKNKLINNLYKIAHTHPMLKKKYDDLTGSFESSFKRFSIDDQDYDLELRAYDDSYKIVPMKTYRKSLIEKSTYFCELFKKSEFMNQKTLLISEIRDVYIRGIVCYINTDDLTEIYNHIDDTLDYRQDLSVFVNKVCQIINYYDYANRFGIKKIIDSMLYEILNLHTNNESDKIYFSECLKVVEHYDINITNKIKNINQ